MKQQNSNLWQLSGMGIMPKHLKSNMEKLQNLETELAKEQEKLKKLDTNLIKQQVDEDDIAAVLSRWTKIPVDKTQNN